MGAGLSPVSPKLSKDITDRVKKSVAVRAFLFILTVDPLTTSGISGNMRKKNNERFIKNK
jgi:hypothetical protein